MSQPFWSSDRARPLILAVACLLALGGMGLRYGTRRLLTVHPLGTTPAPYGFVEYVPPIPGPRPLLIVLHGSASRDIGRDPGVLVDRLSPLKATARAHLLGFSPPLVSEGVLVAAPQTPGDWEVDQLDAFVDYLLASHPVDPDRVYITGQSMGGCGVWRYAAAHAERLAAAMPISGACDGTPELAAQLGALPIHAFHAADDSVVPPADSASWMRAVAARRGGDGVDPMPSHPRGADATAVFDGFHFAWRPGADLSADERLGLTTFASGGHAIWPSVYAQDSTWRWLLSQRRGRAGSMPEHAAGDAPEKASEDTAAR
jgi:predicted peptidase